MKKLLSILLAILLVASCLTFISVSADELTSDDGAYTYTIDDNGDATITKYNGSQLEVIIPSEIDSHKVVEIGKESFQFSKITSVTIPSSVKIVEQNAFAYSGSLASVIFEDGTEQIGRRAFRNCYALTSVKLPNTLKIIEHSAFVLCSKLTSITIPKSVEIISAVLYDSDITNNEVGGAFSDSGLTSITFESGSNLKTIGKIAFNYCKLKEITVPASVETIEEGAFSHSLIESVKFEDNSNLKTIGTSAFAYCEKLTDISLPDSLLTIGQYAFEDSGYYDEETNWQNDVLYIGKYLIAGKDEDNDGNKITFGDYTVKEGTRLIADMAFQWADITKVTFPSSLEYIGHIAFAFSNLNEVVFNDGLETIGNRAFYSTKLTEITIPSTVEVIGELSFGNSSYLTSVTVLSKNVELGKSAFELVATDKTMTIYGYAGSTAQAFAEKYDDNIVFETLGDNPLDPTQPTNPTQPTSPVQPTNPNPTQPTNPTQPPSPIQPTNPNPTQPTTTKTPTTTANTSVNKPTIKNTNLKLSGGKKRITIKYKKVSNADGFQVKYKLKGKWIFKTYNSKKSVTKVIKGLKKGKYKVQVRAFSKVGKSKVYSNWTKAKTIKVK